MSLPLKCSFSGEITSPSNKNLRRAVAAGVRRGFTDERIISLIRRANDSIPADTVEKALKKIKLWQAKRTKSCHSIDPKAHPGVEFIPLPLERQDHGGYLIGKEFYSSIKGLRGIIVVKTPMGSGKTELVMKIALEQADRACYMAHRISLVEESSTRLKISSYRNVNQAEMSVTTKIGGCINSLNHPKFNAGGWFENLDVLCVDECTKVLIQLVGSTVEQPEAVTDTLIRAMNSAGQVIICDADANDNLIQVLSQHTNRKIYVAQNNPKMDHVNVTVTQFEDAYSHALAKATAGETVLAACDSKNDVEKLKRSVKKRNKKIKVLTVTSETKAQKNVEAWIKNPNKESQRWDVVIYNSAVDSGVSITTDHFQHQVGLFRGVIPPDSVIQMMGRNRRARSWVLGCTPITPTVFVHSIEDRLKALTAANLKVQYEAGNEVTELPVASAYDRIRLAMEHSEMTSRQEYAVTLRMMMEQKGYRVQVKEPPEKCMKALRKEMREFGSAIHEENIDLIMSAETPNRARYKELKQAYAVTRKEGAEIIRYEITNSLSIREISREDICFWLDNGDRKDLMFEIMQTERQDLLKYDLWQMKNSSSLSRRANILVKGDLLHKMFETLGINRLTGEGSFNHEDCRKFIAFIKENRNRLLTWNNFRLGPPLSMNRDPKDPTKFITAVLKKLGLVTVSKPSGKARLSRVEITRESWELMSHYAELRKKGGKNVANVPAETDRKTDQKKEDEDDHSEFLYEGYVCTDCSADLDDTAVRWGMGRCQGCRDILLKPEG